MKNFVVDIAGYRRLTIPRVASTKRTPLTPQHQFLANHWKDVFAGTSALHCLVKNWRPEIIVDALAGCGFSAAVFTGLWPTAEIILNDLDEGCVAILKANFPERKVFQEDIREWDIPLADLIFMDINNFTLKRWENWKNVLVNASSRCERLILTDCACYGFNMGNLAAYVVETPEDYYKKLSETLQPYLKKKVTTVCIYGGAAEVVFETTGQLELVDCKPLRIRHIEGFGL